MSAQAPDSRCTKHLREAGLPCSRTCITCGLGPCKYETKLDAPLPAAPAPTKITPEHRAAVHAKVLALGHEDHVICAPFTPTLSNDEIDSITSHFKQADHHDSIRACIAAVLASQPVAALPEPTGIPEFDYSAKCNPLVTMCPRCKNPHHACDQRFAALPAEQAPTDAEIIAQFEATISEDLAAYNRPGECVYQITKAEVLAYTRAALAARQAPTAPPIVTREHLKAVEATLVHGNIFLTSINKLNQAVAFAARQVVAPDGILNKHGHERHCNLMFPATFGTEDDFCDCAASAQEKK